MPSHRIHDPKFLKFRARFNGHTRDVSGYGGIGTWAGTPAYATFPKGLKTCGNFNGASYVTYDAVTEERVRFDAGTQDFTVCTWILRDDEINSQAIVDKRDVVADGWCLRVSNTDRVQIGVNGFMSYSAVGSIGAGEWHHIAGVVDRDVGILIYVDGIYDTALVANPAGAAMSTTTPMRIGARSYDGAEPFPGDLYDTRIYNCALSRDEINAIIHSPLGVL